MQASKYNELENRLVVVCTLFCTPYKPFYGMGRLENILERKNCAISPSSSSFLPHQRRLHSLESWKVGFSERETYVYTCYSFTLCLKRKVSTSQRHRESFVHNEMSKLKLGVLFIPFDCEERQRLDLPVCLQEIPYPCHSVTTSSSQVVLDCQ